MILLGKCGTIISFCLKCASNRNVLVIDRCACIEAITVCNAIFTTNLSTKLFMLIGI